jgi:DNA-binding transcriptional MerR regulator
LSEGNRTKSAQAFRTISEVAAELDLPQHVLRFWETKFSQVRPMKRGGGRRYYRPEDLVLLRRIRKLLYDDGYTIKGVQKLLRDPSARAEVEKAVPAKQSAVEAAPVAKAVPDPAVLREIIAELAEIRAILTPGK